MDGFPGLFLDELLPLRERAAMSDEEMVEYLAHCMVEPGSRRPSIETLLHAFLPARHVDHVHADAICALTNTPDAARHVREALGPDVALVPYIRPGFALSRQVGELADASAVVLEKHGLVTWGETHEDSYGRTLELVARAEAYLARQGQPHPVAAAPDLDAAATEALLLSLRGLLSANGRHVLHLDRSQRAFADRPDVELVATAARATPDHVLRIGAKSLVLHDSANAAAAVAAFAEDYGAYFARHRHRLPPGLAMLSPLPRVLLVPGLGAIATGPDARTARVNAEVAARSHLVTARTLDAFGTVEWLNEADIFDFDYWPLELYKLQSAPPSREFSGRVAIVTGAGTALRQAVADRLTREGAHLVHANGDSVSEAIAAFGGVDVLIAFDPISHDERERLATALQRQNLGGTIVGLEIAQGPTVDLQQPFPAGVRVNAVRVEEHADPSLVAEAIAFLASSRSAATDRTTVPVGFSNPAAN